jgi:hypothetical protein
VVIALRGLSRRQREVLVLRYYEDATEAEIAETLGISTGSVKTHASRGLHARGPVGGIGMSTGELERLERVERLLGAGLHEVDQVEVDVRRGRAKLAPHVTKRRQAVRRRTVIAWQ